MIKLAIGAVGFWTFILVLGVAVVSIIMWLLKRRDK